MAHHCHTLLLCLLLFGTLAFLPFVFASQFSASSFAWIMMTMGRRRIFSLRVHIGPHWLLLIFSLLVFLVSFELFVYLCKTLYTWSELLRRSNFANLVGGVWWDILSPPSDKWEEKDGRRTEHGGFCRQKPKNLNLPWILLLSYPFSVFKSLLQIWQSWSKN